MSPSHCTCFFFLFLGGEELLDGEVALLRDLLVGAHLPEALDDGASVVEGVGGAELLREAVLVPRELEDGAAGTTSNDTGAGTGGAEHDDGTTGTLDGDAMGEGLSLGEGNFHDGLARYGGSLGDGHRHLLRLGAAHPNLALSVAHNHRRAEAHVASTLGHLGHTLHLNHSLLEPVAFVATPAAPATPAAAPSC